MLTHFWTLTHIEEECRRTISCLKGYSYLKLYHNKLSNQKPTANAVSWSITRRTTLCWVRSHTKRNFYSSNLLCIYPSLFEKNLNRAKYTIYERSAFQRRIKTANVLRFQPSISHLQWKPLHFVIYSSFLDSPSPSLGQFNYHLGMNKNMTIALFFPLPPMENYSCQCDDKSKNLE